LTTRDRTRDEPKAPKDARKLRCVRVGTSSQSGDIHQRRRYRVKIDGEWYEGQFSKQWFGWQFDGYRNGIQLNLLDEVFEIVESPKTGGARAARRPPAGRSP
jgi:hypothetical protein